MREGAAPCLCQQARTEAMRIPELCRLCFGHSGWDLIQAIHGDQPVTLIIVRLYRMIPHCYRSIHSRRSARLALRALNGRTRLPLNV
jgi:hypothetical protein